MIEMNWDRIKTLRVHQWRRWQEAAKNNSDTHTQHPFSVGSDSCCQQPHQLSNIPLKNCLADFSIYKLAVEQHLSHNYTTVTDNFHTNHQEKLKTDPKLCKATVPLCENLAKHLLHCFQRSSRGGCPKRKMHKRLSKLTGEMLKYLDVLNDPVNEEIQRSLGDWGLSMWFAYNDTVGSFYWLHMKNTCKCIFTPIQTCFNRKMQMHPNYLL